MTKIGCVHRVPLFNNLTCDEQSKVQELLYHKTFKKGEIIFSPDDPEQLSIISAGAMRIYKLSKTGKEHVNEGEYDGENYLFGLSNDSLYGEAIKETKVCILYKSDFNKLINLYPQLSCKLLQLNAYKSLEIENQLQLLAIDSIEDRLATYFSQLSLPSEVMTEETITIPVSLKELASYLATSPETISRKLRAFQEEGLINRNGKKIILFRSFWDKFDFL
ncbi:MAG: family transcriptional regulator, anaerobic regulatory protein [Enterococcus sp.]|uniref:Crp/Fnr family transcriptional regulator n=1 Tax=Enterococcus sp. TaxID=35783 RepID=UPI002583C6FD|nr:Crp/Fnr family transcriptional regulator [Enterococcus sp.]MDK2845293.1 family transcriptional regulator, anaerobic regulatory protein [Enterococcus sp.]